MNELDRNTQFMKMALQKAKKSANEGEVPVGTIIVYNNNVISSGRNRREKGKNALYHAEIEAINNACKILGGWRLWQCEMFVTLEPCPMCAGAIINARIPKLVFGAKDPKAGSCGSIINLFDLSYNHKPIIISGIMQEECSKLLSNFFKDLRKNNKQL